ncbi:hypothetical protein F511_24984 [Dorcoceras hygrometricum]|uniref:Pollen Ole e 1 allergen and extensin family protein n=1 Tax=Dorcoceras hygrometricum TaxID=472368 RepID=A0A2Z7CX85_9LAMI|nr:hypothetical protein F511_24984 [Dorcoceras hygrometricum]
MSLFWTLIFLSSAFSINCSESKNQKKLPSAVLVGTVYCDTCFHQDFPKAGHVIEGATVAVECKSTRWSRSFRQEVKTDDRGDFRVKLPFSVGKHAKKIEGCSVKLISSNEPYCAVAATAASTSLNLKAKREGMHIFPLNQPRVCDQKPRIGDIKRRNVGDDRKSAVLDANDLAYDDQPYNPPVLGHLPPLPQLPQLPPLPQLPQLPPLPGIPYLPPLPGKEPTIMPPKSSVADVDLPATSEIPLMPNPLNPNIFPPIPLLPPPSLLPPVVPSPPASIFPPVFPAPPPTIFPPIIPAPPPTSPFFQLPPVPGFTPSAPPPPPPFPISFPPFPFQPTPGFPGVPPAVVSSSP